MSNPKNIKSTTTMKWQHAKEDEHYEYEVKQLSRFSGGQELGASLYRLAPGKRMCPFHYHLGNEEAIFILEGSGTLRLGEARHGVNAGDYIALPAGEAHAHQLINTSDQSLTYLCISTMKHPDAFIYPDSKKVGVMGGAAPGQSMAKIKYLSFFQQADEVSYWQGESEEKEKG